jgi:hypothetical protein
LKQSQIAVCRPEDRFSRRVRKVARQDAQLLSESTRKGRPLTPSELGFKVLHSFSPLDTRPTKDLLEIYFSTVTKALTAERLQFHDCVCGPDAKPSIPPPTHQEMPEVDDRVFLFRPLLARAGMRTCICSTEEIDRIVLTFSLSKVEKFIDLLTSDENGVPPYLNRLLVNRNASDGWRYSAGPFSTSQFAEFHLDIDVNRPLQFQAFVEIPVSDAQMVLDALEQALGPIDPYTPSTYLLKAARHFSNCYASDFVESYYHAMSAIGKREAR